MEQRYRLLSLSNSDLILQRSLSLIYASYENEHRESNDGIANKDKDFVFDIHPSLLVDTSKLIIDKFVGEGSHFILYKGWYRLDPVSIKVMLPKNTLDATYECKAKFQREVNLISRIKHQNIVKFIGACVEPSMMIITEFLEGGSLQKHLENIYPRTLDLEQSLSFALDISQAMEYLHANDIIHRDLKPGNLVLAEDKMHIKLSEFGMAREEICGEMTSEAGTYRYMAPELLSKEPLPKGEKKCYDHKADVYSFALVLWGLTKNQIPFKGRSELMAAYAAVRNMRPSVDEFPNDLLPLLQSCWAENPNLRPEFAEITNILTQVLQNFQTKRTTAPLQEAVSKHMIDEGQSKKNSSGCSTEKQFHSIKVSASACLPQSKLKKKINKYKSLVLRFSRCFASF
uniref:Serine/threonine-protein kinase STY13-like n=1 Tax=Cicer arietinum TaxID=3827 RepID=A0A1S2YSP6_CICAR|nr:serine/threonine-protein kinase STY13-like [Cicer arietinum]